MELTGGALDEGAEGARPPSVQLPEAAREVTGANSGEPALTPKSHTQFVKSAVLNRLGAAAGRCGFLAGFSYYELSRLSEANATRVWHYPFYLLGAFTFSIVCNSIWAAVAMKLSNKDSLRLGSSLRFIEVSARRGYNVYQLAFLFYVAGVQQMVAVFNPVAVRDCRYWGWFWHSLFLFEQYILYVMIGILLLLECWFSRAKRNLEMTPVESGEDVSVESVLQMSDRLGGRALFMVGFVQHALARYQYHEKGAFGGRDSFDNERTPDIWLNAAFWHAIILSACFLLSVVYIATLLGVSFNDVPEKMRQRYFSKTKWVYNYCVTSFYVGMYIMLIGASLTGYGCTTMCNREVDNREVVPGGACYAKVAYVPVITCISALVIVVAFRIWLKCVASRARREGKVTSESPMQQAENAKNTMKLVGYIGNSATIAAGFVMYNIATYDTDVIDGPSWRPDKFFGFTFSGYSFLWANWGAFAFGVAAALCVLEVEMVYYDLHCERDQVKFTNAVRTSAATVCGGLYALAMSCFMLAFGLFGIAKMEPVRAESMVTAYLGTSAIVAEIVNLLRKFNAARATTAAASASASPLPASSSTDVELYAEAPARASPQSVDHAVSDIPSTAASTRKVDMFGKIQVIIQPLDSHQIKLQQLQTSSARALLFGGFAYNAVSFLFRPQAVMAPTYTIGMGLSFVSGIYVSLCETAVNMLVTCLPTIEQKEKFICSVTSTIERVERAAILYLVFFLGSFVVLGYIKLWTYDPNDDENMQALYSYEYGWVQLVGAIIGFIVIICMALSIDAKGRETILAEPAELALSPHEQDPNMDFNWDVYQTSLGLLADAAVFQTGNVFYEILFGGLGMNQQSDYLYFVFSVITFIIGSVVLVVTGMLSFWGHAIRATAREDQAAAWVSKTWSTQKAMKTMYTVSLLTWECAMLFSSAVKYPMLWYFSASWSALGIILIICVRLYTRWNLPKVGSGLGSESDTEESEFSSEEGSSGE